MTKRGQALPLNTIIIAIIVITVLVVLIVVFTGGIERFTGGLGDCGAQGGQCMDQCPAEYSRAPLAKCDGNKACCIKVGEATCEELEGTCLVSVGHRAGTKSFVCGTGYELVSEGTCPNTEVSEEMWSVECCKKS